MIKKISYNCGWVELNEDQTQVIDQNYDITDVMVHLENGNSLPLTKEVYDMYSVELDTQQKAHFHKLLNSMVDG